MPFDGSGNFTRVHDWTDDRDNNIKIQASRMDEEFDDIAAAHNEVFFRNGLVSMSGTLDMGNNRIESLASGTVGSPAIIFTTDPNTGMYLAGTSQLAFSVNSTQRLLLDAAGADITGTLDVTGATTLNGAVTAASTLGVTGNATVGGTLGVTGLSTLASLGVTNNATVGGTLGVTGAVTLSSTLAVTGAITQGGTAVSLVGHTHVIADVTGLQTALDAKLASASYTASDVLTKLLTVDGSGSAIDADLLDGSHGSAFGKLASNQTWTAFQLVNTSNNNAGDTTPVVSQYSLGVQAGNAQIGIGQNTGKASIQAMGTGTNYHLWLNSVAGNVYVGDGSLSGVGYVGLIPGIASRSGYIEFRNADASRAGYVGYGDTTSINISAESGRYYNFVGGAAPRVAGAGMPYYASTSYPGGSITVSTSAPSGGTDGDIWFQYT